jgi:hypothetical protein
LLLTFFPDCPETKTKCKINKTCFEMGPTKMKLMADSKSHFYLPLVLQKQTACGNNLTEKQLISTA